MTKTSYKQGHKYTILLKDNLSHEGVFVFENENFIYLKLSSGYNIGISKEKIESFKEIKQSKSTTMPHETKQNDEAQNSGNGEISKDTEILILHTGGTIASKVDYSTGAVNAKFTPAEMLEMFPELKNIAKIDSKLIRNMWSEDIRLAHYNIVAKEIEAALKISSLKGIILTQGTDTLHYTASALSFMFESLPIPVVIVGAQRSSDRPSSDASLNLLSAAFFISKAHEHEMNGVFICMHESNDDKSCLILPPQNIKKLHSSRRDAFKCINCSPLAKVNFEHKNIEMLAVKHFHQEKSKEESEEKDNKTSEQDKPAARKAHHEYKLKLFNPDIKVGIIKSRPGIMAEELKIYEKFDGLILEGTGLGQFPIEQIDAESAQNKKIFDELKKIASKKVVCMTTQTVFGRINMNVYSPARMLRGIGVLGHNLDMISETAYIKLAWLLSNYSPEEAKKLYTENLRGEITERSEKEEFL
jgi:glutamyl-tRNA(Gln) amidotransferase subunit D